MATEVSRSTQDDEHIQSKVQELTQSEGFRQRILDIIKEYTDNKGFIKKVKEYAGEEYDNRILKSARFWFTTVLVTIVTSSIAAVVAFLIARATR